MEDEELEDKDESESENENEEEEKEKNQHANVKIHLKGALFTILSVVGGIAVGLILVFVGAVNNLNWLSGVGVALMVVGVGAGFLLRALFRDKARKTCNKCGKKMDGCEYTWQLDSEEDHASGQRTMTKYVYDIHCTCPHCGEEKHYQFKFTLEANKNPDVRVRNYLKNLYKN